MKKAFLLLLFISSYIFAHAQFNKLKGGSGKKEGKDSTEVKSNAKGGGFFQKVVGKIAKGAGNLVGAGAGTVNMIDNLSEVDIIASVGTNIYPKNIGLMVTDMVEGEWVDNGDWVMLQLAGKNAFELHTYKGAIKVNGKELKHVSFGVHARTDAPEVGVKKFTFEKDGTVEGSFEVPRPEKNLKLLAINGQKANVKIDLTKEVTLEFANYSVAPDALIRVDLVLTTIGLRALYLVAHVKPADKVIIPAAAFSNIETANNFNFKNCYLAVADVQSTPALNPQGIIPKKLRVLTGSNDGMWVEVVKSSENSSGINFTKGNATVKKGNAASAMPLSYAKTIAVSALSTYGTTYLYNQETNNWLQTTTTTTVDFPDVPDAVLDATLEEMYQKFTATIASVNNSTILPAATIPATPSFAETVKFFPEEVNNNGEWQRVYKQLSPVKTLTSVGNRYFGEGTLLKEAKADALLKIKMVCSLSWETKLPAMTPHLIVELVGQPNGDFRSLSGNTKYFSITIQGTPYEMKKNKPVDFAQVVQVDSFNMQLKEALLELKAREQAMPDYEEIWKLQR